jgi:hypothetical protein
VRRAVQDPVSLIFNAKVWILPMLYQYHPTLFIDHTDDRKRHWLRFYLPTRTAITREKFGRVLQPVSS